MSHNIYIYILVMAAVTYLIRMLPLALSRKEITSPFIRSFLYYVPYACLAAMTFPAILFATDSVISAAVGFIVALILLPLILVLGAGAVVIALFAIAVIAIGAGIGACVTAAPAFGALGIGIGLILLSLGLIGLVFFVWASSRALPAILRRFTDFCGNILNRGKKGGDRA